MVKKRSGIDHGLLKVIEVLGGTLDRDEILKRVVEIVPNIIVDADICFMSLWNEGQEALLPIQVRGIPEGLIPEIKRWIFAPGLPVAEHIHGGEAIVIDDVMGSPLLPKEVARTLGIKAFLGIPLSKAHKVFGFIGTGRSEASKPFDRDDELLLKGVARYVAITLENIQLYKESMDKAMELARRVETIAVMHEADKKILSTLDSQEILDVVVQMVSRLIPAERAMIALVDKERRGHVYVTGFGVNLVKGMFVGFGDTTATEVIKTRRSQYCHDLKSLTPLPSLEADFLKHGFRSHIRVPLMVRGEVIGVLCVGSKKVGLFTPEHLSILEKLADQMTIALENARLLTDLQELLLGMVKTLSRAIDAKSPWTAGHSERVTKHALAIVREMGLDELELRDLEIAGLLHDIGKLGIYEAIMDKPGQLTEEEKRTMMQHPGKGAEILSPIRQLKDIIPAIRHHHESYDGSGYPDGVKGEDIPLMARILCVADAVDAMGAERPYREGRSMDKIIEELKRCSGTQFDPEVVEAFLKTKDQVSGVGPAPLRGARPGGQGLET
ncbi:MAG: GAF domain-containing protein [Deltaproteobacteria bacterium]|nr:GAF domain-containing protein [Deltaproteobacteria bacterium]